MTLPTSDDDVLLLHNPRCSKSRATEVLLREQGIAFTVRAYLDDPLTRDELTELQSRLGPASGWVRTGQDEYRQADLDANSAEGELLDAMAAAPILIERPIVVRGQEARIGRPPTNVLELFE
jgi:arsenate reductase